MNRKYVPALLLIGMLAFGLRMVNLEGRPLWYDEAFAVLYASLRPPQMLYGTVTPAQGAGAADVHPLLYYFLLHGWMGLAGRSALAVRFLSVGLGTVTVVLLWRLAGWCFDRRTSVAVGLLAAAHPFHVAYSQEARMYALLGLAAVMAAWGLLRALQEGVGEGREAGHPRSASGRWRWWALYAASAALTLYAHNLGGAVLLALNVLAVARRRWWPCVPSLVLADLVALALFSPWLVGVLPGQVGFVGRQYWLAPPGADEVVRAAMLPVLTFYEPAPLWLLGLGLFVGVLLLALLSLRVGRTRSRAGWFLLLCWGPILALLLASCWRPVYLERALLPSALFYLVAVGWLFVRGELPHALRVGLLALLMVAVASSLGLHYAYARFPRPPFERLVAFLQGRLAAGEVVVHDNKLTFFPAYYYDQQRRGWPLPQTFCPDVPGTGADTLALPTQQALGLFATPIDQAVGEDVTGVWFVAFERAFREYQVLGFEDLPNRAWLRSHCETGAGPWPFNDLLVYHFTGCAEKR